MRLLLFVATKRLNFRFKVSESYIFLVLSRCTGNITSRALDNLSRKLTEGKFAGDLVTLFGHAPEVLVKARTCVVAGAVNVWSGPRGGDDVDDDPATMLRRSSTNVKGIATTRRRRRRWRHDRPRRRRRRRGRRRGTRTTRTTTTTVHARRSTVHGQRSTVDGRRTTTTTTTTRTTTTTLLTRGEDENGHGPWRG